MWILVLVVLCLLGHVWGGCPTREGDVPEGHTTIFGCLNCTCGSDDMYFCTYPKCNVTESVNPCLRYSDGCCAECEEYGCINQYDHYRLVPIGDVPFPSDPCLTCTCNIGQRIILCSAIMCQRPPCRNFRIRPGTCCEFDCMGERRGGGQTRRVFQMPQLRNRKGA